MAERLPGPVASPFAAITKPFMLKSPLGKSSKEPAPLLPPINPADVFCNVPTAEVAKKLPSGFNSNEPLSFDIIALPSFYNHVSTTLSPVTGSRAYVLFSPGADFPTLIGSKYPFTT